MQKKFNDIPFDGYFIPFSTHIGEKTVISKSGLISQTVKIMPSAQTDFQSTIIAALKDIMSPDIIFNIHAIHSSGMQREYASLEQYLMLSQERHASPHNMYEHEFYITISIPGYKIDKSSVGHFLLRNRFMMEIQKNSAKLDAIVQRFCSNLKKFTLTVLSLVKKNEVIHSSHAEFLYKLIYAANAHIPIADIETSEQIKPSSIKHKKNSLLIKRGDEKRHIACLIVKDFPYINSYDIVKIFTLMNQFTVSQTIHHARNNEVKALFEYQHQVSSSLRRNKMSDISSWNEILCDANPIVMQTHFTLYGKTSEELEHDVQEITKILEGIGIVAVREDINLEQVFYSGLPANPSFLNRLEFGTINHAGQFLLSKNMIFSGVAEIQHLPFMPILSTGGKYHALSLFTVNKVNHMLLHGIANYNFTMFLSVLLMQVSQNVRVVCIDSQYSSLPLNKLREGQYIKDVQVNMLNLLKKSKKHFVIFFSTLAKVFYKENSMQFSSEIIHEIRDFCLQLKPGMNLLQMKSLTENQNIHSILDFAQEHNFLSQQDMLSIENNFISANIGEVSDDLRSLKTVYIMLANLHYLGGKRNILKLDRTFDVFSYGVVSNGLLAQILKEYKQKDVSIIVCANIPEQFEHNRTFVYTDVVSKFDISIFMEATCSTQFVKQFFQINSKVAKQLMFVKNGTGKAVVKTPDFSYTIKLGDVLPYDVLRIFDVYDKNFKVILKMIENRKLHHRALVNEYVKLIQST